MVGIFLVVAPRIVAENCIHLEQAEQKNQPATKLCPRYIVETMVAIAQIVRLREADRLDQPCSVSFIRQDRLSQSQVVGVLLIVAGSNKVAGVTLAQQFRYRAARKNGPIIQMRCDQRQHLPPMRLVAVGPLYHHLLRRAAESLASDPTR